MFPYFMAILCVFFTSFGHVLFKKSAISLQLGQSHYSYAFILPFFFGLIFFCSTTILWVVVLQKLELNKAYPIMALGFISVPLLSYFFIGETLSSRYLVGAFFIVIGISLAATS